MLSVLGNQLHFDCGTGKRECISLFYSRCNIPDCLFLFFCLVSDDQYQTGDCGRRILESAVIWLYSIDAADNLFPSIHCLVSWFCFLGIRGRQEIPKWYQYLSCVIAVCVFLSTLMTKQHVVWDVAGGVILAQICFTVSGKTQWYRIYQRFCERIQSLYFQFDRRSTA